MADWVTISALATAGGTLVLAAATFASVRSANRSARATERALLAGIRPRFALLPRLDGGWIASGVAALEPRPLRPSLTTRTGSLDR